MTVEQTHRWLSHGAPPSNLISANGRASEVVVDIPNCPWCVPRDEALAKRFFEGSWTRTIAVEQTHR